MQFLNAIIAPHNMKKYFLLKLRHTIVFEFIAMLAIAATHLRADTPAFYAGVPYSSPPSSFTGTRGWDFSLGNVPANADLYITQLGVYDSNGDGLVNSHPIGLWRNIDNIHGELLDSAIVPAGTDAPLIDGYRWVSISPIKISSWPSGYMIGAQYSAGDADAQVTPRPTYDPRYLNVYYFSPEVIVDYFGGRTWVGPDLHYPSGQGTPCEGCVAETFYEPNLRFEVVPEPSIGLLLLPGLIYLGWRVRKAAQFCRQKNNADDLP